MRTDLFAHNSAASVFTNSPIASGYLYGSSSVSDIEEAAHIAGTFSNLRVYVKSYSGSGSATFGVSTAISSGLSVGMMAIKLANNDLISTGTSGALFISHDNGVTWPIYHTLPITAADINPRGLLQLANGNILCGAYTSTPPGGRVYISTDNGQTWSNGGSGFPNGSVGLGFVETSVANRVVGVKYQGTAGVCVSTDGGVTWATLANVGNGSNRGLTKLTNGDLLMSNLGGTCYYSTDQGVSWSGPITGITDAYAIYQSRIYTNKVYAVNSTNGKMYTGTYTSSRAGNFISWDAGQLVTLTGSPYAVCEAANGNLVCTVNIGTYYISSNQGATWSLSSAPATTLTVSINGTGMFSDVTHTQAVTLGQVSAFKLVPGSATVGISSATVSFTPTTGNAQWLRSYMSITPASGTTTYICPTGYTTATSQALAGAQLKLPKAGTLQGLKWTIITNNRTTSTAVSTNINGSTGAQALAVSSYITGTFEDFTHTDNVSANDLVAISATFGASAESIAGPLSVYYSPATEVTVQATNDSSGYTLTAGTTTYIPFCGRLTDNSATETDQVQPISTNVKLKNLSAYIKTNSITSGTATVRVRVGQADGSQVLTIPTGTTGWYSDSVNTDSVTAGQLVNYKLVGATAGSIVLNTVQVNADYVVGGPRAPFMWGIIS